MVQMAKRRTMRRGWLWAGVVSAVVAAAFIASLIIEECDVCEAATSILLSGTVLGKCTIAVSSTPEAINLNIISPTTQRIRIGSVQQDCNGRRSYIVTMTSMNCATAPAGGKMLDPVSGDYLSYSGEFANPTTGGSSPSVTGLLATSCTGQTGRTVTNADIRGESSTVYVNFTGSPTLGAGVYQDVVTISLNMQ